MAKCKYPNEACAHMTMYHGEAYCDSVVCSARDEIPPPTNADRIRGMSDEELCDVILFLNADAIKYAEQGSTPSRPSTLFWLKQPAETEEK
jgi:hypothetical protein